MEKDIRLQQNIIYFSILMIMIFLILIRPQFSSISLFTIFFHLSLHIFLPSLSSHFSSISLFTFFFRKEERNETKNLVITFLKGIHQQRRFHFSFHLIALFFSSFSFFLSLSLSLNFFASHASFLHLFFLRVALFSFFFRPRE